MSGPRVTVVSSDRQHMQEISRILALDTDLGEVSSMVGGTNELAQIKDAPDVLIINGVLPEHGGLDTIERLGQRHPGTAFIVVTENQTPEFLLSAMRVGVREVVPSPVAAPHLNAAMTRIKQKYALRANAEQGRVLAFISCKGGSGATFLATNFGYALAGLGKRVCLIDLNLQFGDASLYMADQRPSTTVADISREIERLDAALLSMSLINVLPNYGLLAAPEDPAQATDVRPEHIETLIALARRQYDFVIIDAGRNLDAVNIKALDAAETIYPVLQLTLPFVRDGKRLVQVFRNLEYSAGKISLVVNRFQKNSAVQLADLEQAMGHKVVHCIPNSYEAVANSVNQGVAIGKLAPGNAVSKSLTEFARSVVREPAKTGSGWIARLFKS